MNKVANNYFVIVEKVENSIFIHALLWKSSFTLYKISLFES